MDKPTFALTEYEEQLLDKFLWFYQALATGKREPKTIRQKHFVAMCRGQVKANDEHELAYAKYMRLSRLKQDAEIKEGGIAEYEEGTPRSDWCTNDGWKKMRAGDFADMKRRQRLD